MAGKLIVAAAGSGKTSLLVNEALQIKNEPVLITTYTKANEEGIKRKMMEINGCIPNNVKIQTWYSFLLQHGARPYQGKVFRKRIRGVYLVGGMSAIFSKESNTEAHYFTTGDRIYTDKLAKFAIKCNDMNRGNVINRISKIYPNIFIDEVQDIAGDDLDFVKLLIDNVKNVILVGDPRQGTYSTNNASKNKKFQKSKVVNFFEDTSMTIDVDNTSLVTNYRCPEAVCSFANSLYPDFPQTKSGSSLTDDHLGCFLVKKADVEHYLGQYSAMQLRIKSDVSVNEDHKVTTYGLSKGLEFDRVLIYPTAAIIKWIKDSNTELAVSTRSKFYVALTRARYSVGIICDDESILSDQILLYSREE